MTQVRHKKRAGHEGPRRTPSEKRRAVQEERGGRADLRNKSQDATRLALPIYGASRVGAREGVRPVGGAEAGGASERNQDGRGGSCRPEAAGHYLCLLKETGPNMFY
jgi:hypothetical protein